MCKYLDYWCFVYSVVFGDNLLWDRNSVKIFFLEIIVYVYGDIMLYVNLLNMLLLIIVLVNLNFNVYFKCYLIND